MQKNRLIAMLFLISVANVMNAQGLPRELYLSSDLRTLYTGGKAPNGIFDQTTIHQVNLIFPQANYWSLLLSNFNAKIDIPATMIIDGQTYDSVGVRFKGQTSYMGVQNSQKKSFNITTNSFKKDQDIEGYTIFNVNNCYQDESFMREYFFLDNIQTYIPAAKCSYIHLYLNGVNWGLYPMVQQINKPFIKEWFMTNDGTNWRADKPPGGGMGGGWGDGTAALNYLGGDSAQYKQYYTLKSTESATPWADLINGCSRLENTAINSLETMLPDSMDVDRALWHVASEIIFGDDDSYVYKGKMDYFVYYEPETHRLTPLEYDGNSAMDPAHNTWTAFYNQTNANYPLMNRILQVPRLRQRYLAHVRTILTQTFDTATANAKINTIKSLIDSVVLNDPKKLYSYAAFNSEITVLKNFILSHKNNMMALAELNQPTPTISNVSFGTNGVQWAYPNGNDSVNILATVASTNGIFAVRLFYATGVVGNFTPTNMYDDGMHNDGTAGDGVYGAYIPSMPSGSWVRYYIEAASNNSYKSVSFSPQGAEHDVYVYFVAPAISSDTSIVINELMAANASAVADNFGEYDDWIELYNKSANAIDLSGWVLTDDSLNLDKYAIPQGTILNPNSYITFWADEDASQGNDHCNFKLSSQGEDLILLNANHEIVDRVLFGTQQVDQGYARVPNGTGGFIFQQQTFGYSNNLFQAIEDNFSDKPEYINLFPNPAGSLVHIVTNAEQNETVEILNALGETVRTLNGSKNYSLDVSQLPQGIYSVRLGKAVSRLVVQH